MEKKINFIMDELKKLQDNNENIKRNLNDNESTINSIGEKINSVIENKKSQS